MRALGIDLASGTTGLVVLEGNGTKTPTLVMEQALTFKGKLVGVANQKAVVLRIMEVVHHHMPDRIVIEGYSLNMKNAGSVIPLVEIGGLLRFMLNLDGLKWMEPRANELKKFVSGAGNTPKDKIMMHVLKRWGHESIDNNTADAYGLACIGLAHGGALPGITKEMLALVGGLKMRSN
jgi:Holliday junction resolvasome RuvABC endonuclease subunit